MKHIKVGLSTKSIAFAIRRLENIKKATLPRMIHDFLTECCEWIINEANSQLDTSERGAEVIDDIKSRWSYVVSENGFAKIVNSAEKAVYVEFGVGVVGQGKPHPNADEAGYDYNRPSLAKDIYDAWYFYADGKESLDIPLNSIVWSSNLQPRSGKDSPNRLKVYTAGAEGDMFLYNAMMNLISSGQVHKIWNNIKEKYLV